MAVLFALLSAVTYGTSDFVAGLASRRAGPGQVAVVTQSIGVVMAIVAIALDGGAGPHPHPLIWGAISGIGTTVGTLSLYHGLAVGRMTVVATLAGVLTAAIPAAVGVVLGNHLGLLAAIGIIAAIPAIGLVSWQPAVGGEHDTRQEVASGCLAGCGFALLFIALDRAGTRSGAWPVLPGQVVSLLGVLPFALRAGRRVGRPDRSARAQMLFAGVLSAAANLLYLAATGHGQLAVVAVISALYPAVTVLAARVVLGERWTANQVIGLGVAAASVVLVTVG